MNANRKPARSFKEALAELPDYLRGVAEAAEYCRTSPASWHRLRAAGETPQPDGAIGRRGQIALYRRETLDRWLAQRARLAERRAQEAEGERARRVAEGGGQ